MNFRSWIGAICILSCVTTGAVAGDRGAGPTWSGIYVGGHVGWGSGGTDWTYITGPGDLGGPTGSTENQDRDGWLLGGHLGYQKQFGRIVAGIEVSFTGGNLLSSETSIASFDVDEEVSTRLGSLVTATSRLGFSSTRSFSST